MSCQRFRLAFLTSSFALLVFSQPAFAQAQAAAIQVEAAVQAEAAVAADEGAADGHGEEEADGKDEKVDGAAKKQAGDIGNEIGRDMARAIFGFGIRPAVVAPARVRPAVKVDPKDVDLTFLTPHINRELSLIHQVSDAKPEQMDKMIEAATKARDAMIDMVGPRNRAIPGKRIVMYGPNSIRLYANPFERIRKDAMTYAKEHLDTDQFAAYIKEAKAREDAEKEALAQTYAMLYQRHIPLTKEQRQALVDNIKKADLDADLVNVQVYVQNPRYLPQLPEEVTESVLTKTQREALSRASRVIFSSQMQTVMMNYQGKKWIAK